MSRLFSPWQLRQLTLPNRVTIAPMCQYMAKDGVATDWHDMHYGQLSHSGAGFLILEATAVEPEGRITSGCLGLYSEDSYRSLAQLVEKIRRYSDIPMALQIAHAGRKASCHLPWRGYQAMPESQGGWPCVAPSAVAHAPEEPTPTELDAAGLDRIRRSFANAARLADRCGFDSVEIHGAHGYLLHSFLSTHSNHRTDAYGGSFENRLRFPLEVFDAVRDAVDSRKPVGMRISATEWYPGGWDLSHSLTYARELQQHGCDYLDVSSGGMYRDQQINIGPGYQVPLASALRRDLDMAIVAVGRITEPEQAETIVATGQADLVALGRHMMWNPHWPWHAAAQLGATISVPRPYWRSTPAKFKSVFGDITTGMR